MAPVPMSFREGLESRVRLGSYLVAGHNVMDGSLDVQAPIDLIERAELFD